MALRIMEFLNDLRILIDLNINLVITLALLKSDKGSIFCDIDSRSAL